MKLWMIALGGAAAYYFLVMKKSGVDWSPSSLFNKQKVHYTDGSDAIADGLPDPMAGCGSCR